MSGNAVRAGAAYVEIATKQGAFDKGVAAVQASLKRLTLVANTIGSRIGSGFGAAQSAIGSLGSSVLNVKSAIVSTLAVGGLSAFVKQFADATGAVDDMAQRTGMTAEAITGLGYAAKLTGTDIGTMEKGLRKMSGTIVAAASGSKEAASKLAALGLNASQLAAMSPEDQFRSMADALSRVPNQAQRAAMAMEIFGKSGVALLPTIADGAAGIDKLTDEARAMGVVMSSEDAQAGAKLGDVLDQLSTVVGALSNSIGATLAPMLVDIGQRITRVISSVTGWINNNRKLITTLAQYIGIGLAVGAAITGIATAAVGVSMAMAAVGAIVTTVGGVLAGAFAAASAAVAFVLSPLGAVIALLGAGAAAAVYFSGAGTAAIKYLQEKFGELYDTVKPVFDSIILAFTSGQFGEAASLAMLGVELAMRVAFRDLYALWQNGATTLQNVWTDLQAGIATSMVSAVAQVSNVFAGVPTAIMNAFSQAITWLTGTWDQTVNTIAKKLLYLYSLFDKSIDYEKAAKQLDTEASARAQQRQQQLDQTTGARNNSLMQANQQRLAAADATNTNIRAEADRVKQTRTEAAAANTSAYDQGIETLKGQMRDSMGRIAKNAQEMAAAQGKNDKKDKPFFMPSMGAVTEAATAAGPKSGTFSSFAAGMIGSGTSAFDKMVDQQKKSTAILDKIEKNTAEQSDDGAVE